MLCNLVHLEIAKISPHAIYRKRKNIDFLNSNDNLFCIGHNTKIPS